MIFVNCRGGDWNLGLASPVFFLLMCPLDACMKARKVPPLSCRGSPTSKSAAADMPSPVPALLVGEGIPGDCQPWPCICADCATGRVSMGSGEQDSLRSMMGTSLIIPSSVGIVRTPAAIIEDSLEVLKVL